MAEDIEDGKIRIRCTGCGKKVKFPADQPGQTFRCPICKTTMVAPLDGNDVAPPSAQELRSSARRFTPPRPGTRLMRGPEPSAPATEPESQAPQPPEMPIQKITDFLARETDRAAKLCQEIIANPTIPVEAQAAQIRQIRNAKAYHFKQFVEATLKEVDSAIAALRNSPVVETDTGKERLRKMLLDRRGLLLFLNVMYEFRIISAPSAPTGGIPGNATAQPTKASTPDAQTPPRTNGVPPEPGGKAPDNSGPQPS